MCFSGFRRLSGMTRAAGGGPADSRARRRASPPAVNFFRLRLPLAMVFAMKLLGSPLEVYHRTPCRRRGEIAGIPLVPFRHILLLTDKAHNTKLSNDVLVVPMRPRRIDIVLWSLTI